MSKSLHLVRCSILIAVTLATNLMAVSHLKTALNKRDPMEAGAYFRAWLMETDVAMNRQQHTMLIRLLTSGGAQHTCMHVLVLDAKFLTKIEQLALSRPGQRVAAHALATHAVMKRCWMRGQHLVDLALADELVEGVGQENQSREPITEVVDKARVDNFDNEIEVPPEERESIVTLLVQLLASPDRETRTVAAIAAAQYAFDHPDLDGAMAALEDATGPTVGARLLFQSRRFQSIDQSLVELAFTEKKDQPKNIAKLTPIICGNGVITPAAALAAEALGVIGPSLDTGFLPHLHRALTDHDDIRVQSEAARALRAIGNSQSAAYLLERLQECAWPVYLECSLALTQCRDASLMLELMEHLKGSDGRMRQYLLYALSAWAGHQYGRVTYQDWYDWWGTQDGQFIIDHEASDNYLEKYGLEKVSVKAQTSFYDMKLRSRRLVFILDRSGSMLGNKLAVLMENMKETLRDMEQGVYYNIISYGHDLDLFKDSLVTDRRAGFAYVDRMQAGGGTNIYDSTFAGLMNRGATSLCLLTDGAPSHGLFTDWEDISASVLLWNRYRPLTINTIAIEAGEPVAAAMKLLSQRTGGEHVSF